MTMPVMPPTIELIQRRVADAFGVRVVDILSRCRRRHSVRPRHAAIYLARRLTPATLEEIGHYFRRDHTSIMAALDAMENALARDATLTSRIARLERDLTESAAVQVAAAEAGAAVADELRQVAARAIARDPKKAAAAILEALRPLAAAAALIALLGGPARADPDRPSFSRSMIPTWCGPRDEVLGALKARYGEEIVSRSASAGMLIERTEGPSGSWTIITSAGRFTCIVLVGEDWQEIKAVGGGI